MTGGYSSGFFLSRTFVINKAVVLFVKIEFKKLEKVQHEANKIKASMDLIH